MKDTDENWLEDAFNDKKEDELNKSSMTGSSKVIIGIGCAGFLILGIVLIVSSLGFLSALSAA